MTLGAKSKITLFRALQKKIENFFNLFFLNLYHKKYFEYFKIDIFGNRSGFKCSDIFFLKTLSLETKRPLIVS